MPASRQEKVTVACPHCAHPQAVAPTAVSTVCKKCARHFEVQEVLKPKAKKAAPKVEKRKVACLECGAELQVPVSAETSMCKTCGKYVDLRDYRIANAVSRNFRTHGAFIVEPKGYVFNTEAIVAEAVIKGRFLGKLTAERSLTIHSTAEIKGTFTAGRLIIPAQNHFRWPDSLKVGSAEISGELAADVIAADTVIVRASGLLFGNVQARNLVVEPGAVVVGAMRIGEGGKDVTA
jgi:cytoskeletal protein CcmA (bactofilin family)